jgi:hypothetical protein
MTKEFVGGRSNSLPWVASNLDFLLSSLSGTSMDELASEVPDENMELLAEDVELLEDNVPPSVIVDVASDPLRGVDTEPRDDVVHTPGISKDESDVRRFDDSDVRGKGSESSD